MIRSTVHSTHIVEYISSAEKHCFCHIWERAACRSGPLAVHLLIVVTANFGTHIWADKVIAFLIWYADMIWSARLYSMYYKQKLRSWHRKREIGFLSDNCMVLTELVHWWSHKDVTTSRITLALAIFSHSVTMYFAVWHVHEQYFISRH